MHQEFDIAIIGGGIVGVATLFQLQQRHPSKSIVLIEKEEELAVHQTGHNSGVIHSGLYYKPGSLKAINCMKGREGLVEFCKKYGVDHDVCGKVVVATDEKEVPYMEKILETGRENGLTGIEKITAEQVKEIEPYVESVAGLWVPQTGIVDYVGMTKKMAEVATGIQAKSVVRRGEEALSFSREGGKSIITTSKDVYHCNQVIFCGGLQADRLASKDGVKVKERVVGFRGDYYELTDAAKHKVKNLIYPVPDPAFPFLGVHFTRMCNREIECGPNAVFTFKREGYGKTDFNLRDTIDALSYSGTWKLFLNNISFGINEYRRAFSKRLFLKTLQRIIPSLTMEDLKPGRSGVRAMLLSQDGDTRDDFRIESSGHSLHVLNAPSPAATASLAIGEQLAQMAEEQFDY